MDRPLISLIMPTADRRPFVALAIEDFARQTYRPLELVVVDDGADTVADICEGVPGVTYVRLPFRRPIGDKRNTAIEESSGEIIAHADDDDWSHPGRIETMVDAMTQEGAEVAALGTVAFYDLWAGLAWVTDGEPQPGPKGRSYVHGGSLIYTRDYWRRRPFRAITHGEDADFVKGHGGTILSHCQPGLLVAMIHGKNTSTRPPNNRFCRPAEPGKVTAIMGADWPRWNELSAVATAPPTCRKCGQ